MTLYPTSFLITTFVSFLKLAEPYLCCLSSSEEWSAPYEKLGKISHDGMGQVFMDVNKLALQRYGDQEVDLERKATNYTVRPRTGIPIYTVVCYQVKDGWYVWQ